MSSSTFALLAILLNPLALLAADFSGTWVGAGSKFDLATGESKECSLMIWEFLHTPEIFAVRKSEFLCGNEGAGWGELEFSIEGDRLLFSGHDVGFISADRLEMFLRFPGVDWNAQFELIGKQLRFEETEALSGSNGVRYLGSFTRN